MKRKMMMTKKKDMRTWISYNGYPKIYIKFIGYTDDDIVWTQVNLYRYENTTDNDYYFRFMKELRIIRDDKVKTHNTKIRMYFSDAEEYQKAKEGEDIRICDEKKRIRFFDEP